MPAVRPPGRDLRPRRRARSREKLNYTFLGEIPLDLSIREQSDSGKPVALDDSTIYGKAFEEIAAALRDQVTMGSLKTPEDITIE